MQNFSSYFAAFAQQFTVKGSDLALFGAVMISMIIFTVVSYVIGAFLLGRVFKKAGVDQWIAWVPVYNLWKLLEIGGQQGLWAVVAIVPFAGIASVVFIFLSMYEIGKKLGKSGWFVLLAIFAPVIWMVWLGFDDSKWPVKKEAKKP